MDKRTYAIGIGAAAFAGMYARGQTATFEFWDYVFFGIWLALMWWCLGPSRSNALVDTDGHEQTRQGVAFCLGKTLNRVRSRFRR